MAPFMLILNLSKILGVAGTLGIGAYTVLYQRFRRKNLAPFQNPIDETQDILADFPIDRDVDEEGGFFFALATAPAHVEDELNDAWLQFAMETPPKEEANQNKTPKGSPTENQEKCSDKEGDEKKEDGNSSGGEKVGVEISQGEDNVELPKEESHFPLSQRSTRAPLDQSKLLRSKGDTGKPLLQYDLPKKVEKLARIAIESIEKGFEKLVEDDDKVNVAAWHNTPVPEQRLRFWTDPDTELRLAQKANIKLFRMGVDWSRVMPIEPVEALEKSIDWAALDHYRMIIEKVRAYGMRVMLTLFHHSLPPWAVVFGGWKSEKTVNYFTEFTRLSVERFADLVDYWVTFNEPHVFATLTYCAGTWPGDNPDLLEAATSVLPKGSFQQAIHHMAVAHLKAYDLIHDISKKADRKPRVGVAHHVSFMRPYGLFDVPAVILSDKIVRYGYIDDVCKKLDFLGINYYGEEVVSAPGLKLVEKDEYSESGRGVYPDGLYRTLLDFHDRYKELQLPFIITENGVSDATDFIRRPYLLEHLLAVRAAMNMGVRIQGYCFWTTSDNWEWADGYGPKFGLVAVDRAKDLHRIPRPSYYLFSEVARTGKITTEQREKAWSELQRAAAEGMTRPFWRAVNSSGLMYSGGLDEPIEREFSSKDWRFGHYQYDGLQDPLCRLIRFLSRIPHRKNIKGKVKSKPYQRESKVNKEVAFA